MRLHPDDAADQSRLSAAAGAEKTDNLAGRDASTDVPYDVEAAAMDGHIDEVDRRIGPCRIRHRRRLAGSSLLAPTWRRSHSLSGPIARHARATWSAHSGVCSHSSGSKGWLAASDLCSSRSARGCSPSYGLGTRLSRSPPMR